MLHKTNVLLNNKTELDSLVNFKFLFLAFLIINVKAGLTLSLNSFLLANLSFFLTIDSSYVKKLSVGLAKLKENLSLGIF
jgi:hypothetical protein